MGRSTLGVVILAYGAGDRYLPLIESLLGEGIEAGQIVVVHNPSEPGQTAPPVPAGCRLLRAPYNLGYAAGMNLGLKAQLEADAELLLLLTHDVQFMDGGLAALLDAGVENPGYGVLGPVLMLSRGGGPFSFGGTTRRDGVISHVQSRPPGDAIASCDWVDGGVLLLRTDVVRQVGGFDERFWSYCEEAEFCLRVARAGHGVGVVLAAEAEQEPGGSKRRGPWAYLTTRNGFAYVRAARGSLGLAAFLGWTAYDVALELARVVLRGLRLRPGPVAEPWVLAVCMTRGAVDYARGRWGPPPLGLPGRGDIRNTRPLTTEPELTGVVDPPQARAGGGR
jgi:N-acetylglucosaminyl-diphospho-decaprenol L-rhamnosyltransferase